MREFIRWFKRTDLDWMEFTAMSVLFTLGVGSWILMLGILFN